MIEQKKFADNEEGEEAEVTEEKGFEVERTRLFNEQAPGHSEHCPCSKRQNDTSAVKQAVHLWRNELSFAKVIKTVVYDAPGEVNTMRFELMNLMSNIPSIRQHVCVYKVKGEESEFKLLIRLEQKYIA